MYGIIFLLISFACSTVIDLPDYPYKGNTHSGYLDIGGTSKKLHYIFVESQTNPSKDPLVLWLNGGPGCSSLLGWSQEHGPAVFGEESTIYKLNPYSWNIKANVLYIESPAGVGFSYGDERDIDTDDTKSAADNLLAVLDFFAKFPSFAASDFYISGESYAGIYVPYLAYNIINYNEKEASKINLKGIIVGNGVTDWKIDTEPAFFDFAFNHGLYSHELRADYLKHCVENIDNTCAEVRAHIGESTGGINIYDVLGKCFGNPKSGVQNSKDTFSYNNYTPWIFKKSSPNSFLFLEEFQPQPLKDSPPCVDSVGPDAYFNRKDVKEALGVKQDINWSLCSENVQKHYKVDEKGSFWIYPTLLKSKLKILIFTGDTDGAVPFTGTLKWIRNLNLKINKPWRKWVVTENNVAGYAVDYEGLQLVTVKGTGHMVPQWKPKEAFHMYTAFLEGMDI